MGLDDGIRQIAVVDDDESVQRTISYFLRQKGYDVLAYRTGAQAINGLITYRPGVALIDFGLPDINGVKVYEAVLRAGVPVQPIFISGIIGYITDINSLLQDTDLGHLTHRHFMAKPLIADELLIRIEDIYSQFLTRENCTPSVQPISG